MSNLGYLFFNDLYKVKNQRDLTINEASKRQLLNFTNVHQNNQIHSPGIHGFELYTTYPGLTTGTGLPHGIKGEDDDFKIGSYFDYTTGLPTLPGSSVKGVLRSMFPTIECKQNGNESTFTFKDELKDSVKAKWLQAQFNHINEDEFFEKYYPPEEQLSSIEIENLYKLSLAIFEGVKNHTASEPKERLYSIYQRDIFEDAYIIESNHMGGKVVGADSITPHIKEKMSYAESQLKNPKPLLFLKVLPNVQFRFNFMLHDFDETITAAVKEKLFKKILLTIGAGAKTNVGYGQFSVGKIENESTGAGAASAENSFKTHFIENDGLQKNSEVKGVVESTDGDRINFKVLITDYPKSGNTLHPDANFLNEGDLILLKINKVKDDKTYTFIYDKKLKQ